MTELQAAASVRALCYFSSLGPSSAGQGLGEQAQGSCKAIWLVGQEIIVNCLVTHIATSPDPRPGMVSCISGHCSRQE